MTLRLERDGTKPPGVEIKTWGIGKPIIYFGDYEISMEDFLIASHYVLTNTDLYVDDPRIQFVRSVQAATLVEGYMRGQLRFTTKLPPVHRYRSPFGD